MAKNYDVVKFIDQYYPDAHLTSNDKEYVLLCPWCEHDKRKLYVSIEKGVFNCFHCEAKGTFFALVKKTLALNKDKEVGQAIREFESSDPITFLNEPDVRPSAGGNVAIQYPDGYYPLYGGTNELGVSGKQALDYLLNRGLTLSEVAYYKLGFCLVGKYEKRIIIPILNDNNELVSFVARDYTSTAPAKVLTPAALPGTSGIKDYVFNLQNAKHTRELIIGEGVFDAIALGVSGIAILGKQATEKQVQQILLDNPLKIVVSLDADAPKENQALALRLSTYNDNVYLATLPEGDPASVSKEVLAQTLKNAVKFNKFPEVI